MPSPRTQRAIAAIEAAWPHLAGDAFVEQVALIALQAAGDSPPFPGTEANAYQRGLTEGRRQAIQVVRAQAGLPDLVHFDRPSDFRKGVLSCLAALEADGPRSEGG